MFTGIVEAVSTVQSRTNSSITIERPKVFSQLTIGQSIACNGACLSVTQYNEESISFDVLSETQRRTNLGESLLINLERAMPANGRFEGHIVLGHVDETIYLQEVRPEESGKEYIFSLPTKKKYLVHKGSIGINGVSLTIGTIMQHTFSVFIIPLTLQYTNFSNIQVGEKVNIEYDYLGKLVLGKREK